MTMLPMMSGLPSLMGGLSFGAADEDEEDKSLIDLAQTHRKSGAPLVIMFIGRRGQGKTLGMTTLANVLVNDWRAKGINREVLSNYWVQFASKSSPYLVDEMLTFPSWLWHKLVLEDEIQSAFPGRRSLAGVNVEGSNLLTQIRKLDVEFFFTTQFPQVMDYQILLQVDLFILCEKENNGKDIHLMIYDWWGQWTGNMFKKPWPPAYGTHDFERWFHNCDRVFPLYRTNEYQPAIWSKTRNQQIGRMYNVEEDDDSPDAPLKALPAVPQTVDEFLELQGKALDLRGTFDAVRNLGGYKNINEYAKTLQEKGYNMMKGKYAWVAEKAPPRRINK